MKIYEIQNKGKGLISSLEPSNLLLLNDLPKIMSSSNIMVFGEGTDDNPFSFYYTGTPTQDATSLLKGVLKLSGDLGGTADAPTTPTAVHKYGEETIFNTKTFDADQKFNYQLILMSANTLSFTTQYSNVRIGTINNHFSFSSHGKVPASLSTENLNSTSSVKLLIPNQSGIIPITVNGASADINGNISTNRQRVITANTTLSNTDNDQTIFVNNGTTPITITINTTVTTVNFGVGFIQEGTGDVTFVGTGVSLTNPVGLKSKGQGYATYIERKLGTNTFYLLGDTKA